MDAIRMCKRPRSIQHRHLDIGNDAQDHLGDGRHRIHVRDPLLTASANNQSGGTTLTSLLEGSEPWLLEFEISGLVRNESAAQVIRAQGANAVVCSGFEDEERLQALAEDFDSKSCSPTRTR